MATDELARDVRRQLDEVLAEHIAPLRAELATQSAAALAARSGADYDAVSQQLRLDIFGQPFVARYPDFQVSEAETGAVASVSRQALVLYYLKTATGAPVAERWISFRELRDGRHYHQAFQGYSGNALLRALDGSLARFRAAAEALGATPQPMADAAYTLWALPRVPLAVVFWAGDDEFPTRLQVLFDASASDYLPTASLAGLGSELCARLRRADAERHAP